MVFAGRSDLPDEAGQELHPAFDVKKSILSARILRQEYSSPRPADRLMANVILPAERGPEYLPSLDGQISSSNMLKKLGFLLRKMFLLCSIGCAKKRTLA